jgi:hypothetical protein
MLKNKEIIKHKRAKKKTTSFCPRMAPWTSTKDRNHRVFLRERGEGERKIESSALTHGVQRVHVLWLRASCSRYGTIFFCIKVYQQTVRPCGIANVHDPDRTNATSFLSLLTNSRTLGYWHSRSGSLPPATGPREFRNRSRSVEEKNPLTLEDGTDRLSLNVGKELPLHAA